MHEPKPTAAEALRDVLNAEPEPWASTVFLWTFTVFMTSTALGFVTALVEAIDSWS